MLNMSSKYSRQHPRRARTRGVTGRHADVRVGMSAGHIQFPASGRSSHQEPKISRGHSAAFRGIASHVAAFGVENSAFDESRTSYYKINKSGAINFG